MPYLDSIIDVTMTAALRPSIITRTLDSFINIAPKGRLNLVANICRVGEPGVSQEDVAKLLLLYFPNAVLRQEKNSSHPNAVQWIWKSSTSNYVLHWEDDWVLLNEINLDVLLLWMENNPNCGMLWFDRIEKPVNYNMGQYAKIDHNIWEKVISKSLGGPPAILRREYIRDVLSIMDDNTDLDILSRTQAASFILDKWMMAVYTGASVKDIGTHWRVSNSIKKLKNTGQGLKWAIPKGKNDTQSFK